MASTMQNLVLITTIGQSAATQPTSLCLDRSAWRTLCHEAVTQFKDSRVEALEHKKAVWKEGFNLAATTALGHVTAALASAAPELDSIRPSTNSPMMTSDPSFSTAQSVPFRIHVCYYNNYQHILLGS